jgi:hypothetical protein
VDTHAARARTILDLPHVFASLAQHIARPLLRERDGILRFPFGLEHAIHRITDVVRVLPRDPDGHRSGLRRS